MVNINNTKNSFGKRKRNAATRRKLLIRIMAVIGSLLMLSGVIGSMLYYLW